MLSHAKMEQGMERVLNSIKAAAGTGETLREDMDDEFKRVVT